MDILPNNSFLPENIDYLFRSVGRVSGVTTRYLSQYTIPEAGENGYKSGNIIRIRFPSEFIDFGRHWLQFSVSSTKTGGTYLRSRFNASCNFIRARLLFGSTEITLTDNLPLIDTIIQLSKTQGTIQSTNALIRGCGDQTQRNAEANTGKVYCVYLGDVLKLLSHALPLQHIQTTLTLELTVNTPELALESDGSNLALTINSVQFHYDTIQCDQTLDNLIKSQIQKNLCIVFQNYQNEQNTSQTQNVLKLNAQLSFKYVCLSSLLAVARNTANFAANVNDVYAKYENYNNFVSGWVKLNNVYIPADKVNNSTDAVTMYISYMGGCNDDEYYLFYNWPQYFLMGFSFMQDSKALESKDPASYIQGVSSSLSGFSLQYNQDLSANPYNLQYDFFALNYACIRINPDGSITFSQ